mgnify:CR=1 FL=1
MQKQYVHAQSFKQKENERHFKKQLDDLQNQIDDFPLIREYLYLQTLINDMLETFTETIETGIHDVLKEGTLK